MDNRRILPRVKITFAVEHRLICAHIKQNFNPSGERFIQFSLNFSDADMVCTLKGKIMPPEKIGTTARADTSEPPRSQKKVTPPKGKPLLGSRRAAPKVKPYHVPTGPIALVGLMGVGKTTVGRRLAKELGRPFYDSDDEIEKASGRTVAGYFRDHGEAAFRGGERRVIDRLLNGDNIILATGGGAFIEDETREILNDRALTIFLKGDFETIFTRVRKKDTRPLLKVADPRATFRELYDARYPIYAQSHITVEIAKGPHARTVTRVLKALEAHHKRSTSQSGSTP